MDDRQYPYDVAANLMHHAVALVWEKLADARYLPCFAEHRMSDKRAAASLNSSSILVAANGFSFAMNSHHPRGLFALLVST